MRTRNSLLLLFVWTTISACGQAPIRGLESSGPDPALKEKLDLFGQFVGDWDFDMVLIRPDGTRLKGTGEWHFGWILEGRAIQDVWIAHDDLSKPDAPVTEWGTTVRFYDPRIDAWHVVWAGPMRGNLITFTGKKIEDEIVMEVDSVQGLPETKSADPAPARRGRWIFDHIARDSFHWRAVTSRDGGRTWQVDQEMFVRRKKLSI